MNSVSQQAADIGMFTRVNLHLHTTCSDGALTPKMLVNQAVEQKLDIISITDHDTVTAYGYLSHSSIPLKLLPGIELSSTWGDEDIHLLAFGVDITNKKLLKLLRWMSEGRRTRAHKMLHKLSELGMKVPFETVLSFAGEKKLIVRPHIAQALVSYNFCQSKQEAFEKYIGNDKPAYIPKPVIKTTEAIEIIHSAGGVAVLAHPGKLQSPDIITNFVKAGLDGIEVNHPDHSNNEVTDFIEFARVHNLLKTVGSDFHGEKDIHNYFGAVPVTAEIIDDIREIWRRYLCKMKR